MQHFIQNPQQRFLLVVLAVLLEPCRFLTCRLLKASSDTPNYSRIPLACDAACDRTSPFLAALQYVSSLLYKNTGRTLLIWKSGGYDSYENWATDCPSQQKLFRQSAMLVSSWLWRRRYLR